MHCSEIVNCDSARGRIRDPSPDTSPLPSGLPRAKTSKRFGGGGGGTWDSMMPVSTEYWTMSGTYRAHSISQNFEKIFLTHGIFTRATSEITGKVQGLSDVSMQPRLRTNQAN